MLAEKGLRWNNKVAVKDKLFYKNGVGAVREALLLKETMFMNKVILRTFQPIYYIIFSMEPLSTRFKISRILFEISYHNNNF